MNRRPLSMAGPVAALLLSLTLAPLRGADAPSAKSLSRQEIAASVTSSMDPKADPCNDFYRYACGGWLDTTKMPSDQARWVRSFSTITERNRELVKTLLENAGKNPGTDPERRQIGDFYASCMDEGAVEKAGLSPLAGMFTAIDQVSDPSSLMSVAAGLSKSGVGALFGGGAAPDFKNPTMNLLFLTQGGLGLPDRDYYVSEDPKKQEILAKYETHVARMLGLAGESTADASGHAKAIVAFETELARASRPRAEMRDRDKIYNKIDRAGLEKLAPGLAWPRFFATLGYPDVQSINVAVPEFFQALERLAGATPAETLRAYLRWNVVDSHADRLPKAFVEANFEFFGKTLSGQQEIQPRWKRCVTASTAALGEAIGKLYVAEEFAGNSKAVAVEMIRDIENAFESNLPALAWMDDTTRKRAVEKAQKVSNKIGYPDVWRDYSTVAVKRGDYFASAVSALRFEFDRDMKKVGQPVDRNEWRMVPQQVNAYYMSTSNEIAFPAGILQPPFFHKDFPAAMNYGAVGTVMGHELTHGFDDQGRKSDGDGVLREWWEPEVAAKFEKQAACVEAQYSAMEVEPGVHVNGKLTLGENIGDIGGVKEAYVAFQGWKSRHRIPAPGEPKEPLVPGLTDDQLFFVSFSQVWCSLSTPEFLRNQVTTDSHSPGQVRAILPLVNLPEFATAFSCPVGSKMNPKERCTVW
jgi:putative endopeptidase